jgi:hypothetical protein
MNKPTTLLWLGGVLETFVGTLTFQLPLSPTVTRDLELLNNLKRSYMQDLHQEETVGLRIIKTLLRGTTQVELTHTL